MLTPIAVKLDTEVHRRIKALAEARNRSPHWMIREAISQYVECEEKRDAFHQDGVRAWDVYQETRLHVAHAEADVWLTKLASGDDQEPPECHN